MAWGSPSRSAYGYRDDLSKSGYPDPLAEQRRSQVGLSTQPADGYENQNTDWVKMLVDQAESQQMQRDYEDQKRANDLEEALALSRQSAGVNGDFMPRDEYIQRTAQRYGMDVSQPENYDFLEKDWVAARDTVDWSKRNSDKLDFLFPKGNGRDEFQKDPLDWLTRQQADPGNLVANYEMPPNAAEQVRLRREAVSQSIGRPYAGETRGASPGAPNPISLYVSEGLRAAGAPDIVADIGGGVAPWLVPFVGPALGGAAAGSEYTSTGNDLLDAIQIAQVPVNAALFGTPIQKLGEGALLSKLGLEGAEGAGRALGATGVRAGYGAGANVALSAPSVLTSDAPTDEKLHELALAAGVGAVGGGAGSLLSAGKFLPDPVKAAIGTVAPELFTAATTYAVAKKAGADDDTALKLAIGVGGATAVRNPAFRHFITDTLPAALARAQGREGREPAIGLGIEAVSPTEGGMTVYHGSNQSVDSLREGAFVTPSRADAETYARATARANGGEPVVSEFTARPDALTPVGDSLAGARGAMQVTAPEGVRPAGGGRGETPPPPPVGSPPPGSDGSGGAGTTPPVAGKQPGLFERGWRYVANLRNPAERVPELTTDFADDVIASVDSTLGSHPVASAIDGLASAAEGTAGNANRRFVAGALRVPLKIMQAIDPASRYARPVLRAAAAMANMAYTTSMEMAGKRAEIAETLKPLIGNTVAQRGARLAGQAVPLGASVAASQFVGDDDKASLIAAGIFGSALAGATLPKGRQFFEGIKYKTVKAPAMSPGELAPLRRMPASGSAVPATGRVVLAETGHDVASLPDYLRSGQAKLAHMILHPGDFQLSDKQLAAVQKLQPILQAAFDAQNQFEAWAGIKVTEAREGNRLFQMWTPESWRKATERAQGNPIYSGESGKPPFLRPQSIQMERTMGENVVDAIMKHPDLRLGKDVFGLIMSDLEQKANIMQNATMLKALTTTPEGAEGGWYRSSKVDELRATYDTASEALAANARNGGAIDGDLVNAQSAAKQALDAELQRRETLGVGADWQPLAPEIPGVAFSPELLNSLKALAPEKPGEFAGGVGGLIDRTTSNIRTLLFSTDFSPWTVQGLMMAATNPEAFVRSAPQMLAASVLGDRYTAAWLKSNYGMVRDWGKAGLAMGRGIDELVSGKDARRLPIVHGMESRGFENFLPIARLVVANHTYQGHLLMDRLGFLGKTAPGLVAREALTYAPLAAAIGLGIKDDADAWEMATLVALGGLGTMAAGKGLELTGSKLGKGMSEAQQQSVRVRITKEMNRSSGIMNKAQYGISRNQAAVERNLFFNSPAFTRNMLIAAKHGLEGAAGGALVSADRAMATMYLFRTAALAASTMVGLKLALTGEMDSLSPSDPDSVLNPRGFAKIQTGPAGGFVKASFSNPLIGMARAIFKTPVAQGESKNSLDGWSPLYAMSGLIDNLEGRTPQLASPLYQMGRDALANSTSRPGQDPNWLNTLADRQFPSKNFLNESATKLGQGDVAGAARSSVGQLLVPLPVQAAAKAGYLKDIGEKDPNINHAREGATTLVGNLLGMNANPETLSEERRRLTDAGIRKQFAGEVKSGAIGDSNGDGLIGREDLNIQQKKQFDATDEGKAAGDLGEQVRGQFQTAVPSGIDLYTKQLDESKDREIGKLQQVEQMVASGQMSKQQAREAFFRIKDQGVVERRQVVRSADATPYLGEDGKPAKVFNPATGQGEFMTVGQYLDKNMQPADKAVDGYYAVFDQASGPDGKLDFDKLERLQDAYMRGLSLENRQYVENHLTDIQSRGITNSKGESVMLPTYAEYQKVKALAKPYWEIRDSEFTKLQQKDKFFQQFENYNDFRDEVRGLAQKNGIQEEDVIGLLSRKHHQLRTFDRSVTKTERTMRGANLALDFGLEDFYGRPTVNWEARIAQQYGDPSYDNMGARLSRRPTGPSRAQQIAFARRYARTNGSASGSDLMAAFGL